MEVCVCVNALSNKINISQGVTVVSILIINYRMLMPHYTSLSVSPEWS